MSEFTVVAPNGYVDAGVQTAKTVISSSVYENIVGTVTVTPRKSFIISGEVANKTYDGTTTGTLNTRLPTTAWLALSAIRRSTSRTLLRCFRASSAGTGKSVSLTFSGLSNGANGGKASNYTIGGLLTNGSPATSGTATTTANITPKTLTASFTGTNETYNGTTTDAVSYVSLNGVIGTDIVSLSTTPTTGAFSDANAGTGKTVTISGLSLTGSSAGNYTIATTTTTTASITPLVLQLSGVQATTEARRSPARI